jgi:predicted Zn-dependent protease with MMP-like domain
MAEQATYAPDLGQIEQFARAAVERLPEAFRAYLGDVVIRAMTQPVIS